MVYYLSLCHAEYLIPSIPIGKCGNHPNDAKRNPNDRATLGTTYISRVCNAVNIMQLDLASHLADIMVLCVSLSLNPGRT